ncbi:MAG: acyl-CoA thioesterase [Kiloniellales bacterium]|nr:acyl-CoA thioesterase [Kiloniellales bacterium]
MAEDSESQDQPRGEMQTRTLAMPADANPSGDIFGGWVLAQMDIAGGIAAAQIAKGRVATVAVTAMTFHLPVLVGDVLCVYASEPRIGRTSITLNLEAWALRRQSGQRVKVTQGEFVFVALDESGQPRAVTEEQSA